jgi:hypothetical protein
VSFEEVLLVTAPFHIDDTSVLGLLHRVVLGDDVDVSETHFEACSLERFCVSTSRCGTGGWLRRSRPG